MVARAEWARYNGATQRSRGSSPVRRTITACFLALALVLAPLATAPAAAFYIIDAGDVLTITIRGSAESSFAGLVRADGIIQIPFLGEIDVRGLTADQVRERVRALASRTLRDPIVNVAITGYRPRIVTVVGEVHRPGNVDLIRPDQTVLDVIAAAGGFTDHAIANDVAVLRGNGANSRRLPVDVQLMLRTGDLSGNIKLEPGDRVQVPRSLWPTWQEVWQGAQITVGAIGTVTSLILLWDRVFPPTAN